MKVAMQNERNSIGYETEQELLPTINKKIENNICLAKNFVIIKR